MQLIDTHTHLYQSSFINDIQEVMDRAKKEGVDRFYLPAIDSEVIPSMFDLEKKYPETCFAMMGLHPCSVKENYMEELAIVKDWLLKRPFPAIGEIGLDFYWDTSFKKEQFEAFHMQIEWAIEYDLPIVIHTRNAMQDTIDVVKSYKNRNLKGIFHCFGDDLSTANQIIETGFLLGIGGVVTYKNGGLDEVLKQVPLQSIVLETDSPYLTPVPFRGKRNESSYLKYIAEKLALIYQMPVQEIARATTANALNLFKY